MSDVYKIGVAIALSNGMSPALSLIAKQLLGINASTKSIEANIGRWKLGIGGFGAAFAGAGIVGAFSKVAEHGKEILHQQELLKQAGFANKQIVEATTKAWEQSRAVQQTTAAENLKHIRELAYATGTIGGAEGILGPVTKANAILNSVKGGGTDQVFQMVKALEQKGLATEENRTQFLKYIDDMTRVVQSTGGRVDSTMFQQTFKYGRTAMLAWDEPFITRILPRLMQSWSAGSHGGSGGGGGAGGPGNALMTAFQTITSGLMSKSQARELDKLGLLESIHNIKGSSKVEALVKGRDLFMANPYEWVQQIMMPSFNKIGITGQNDIIAATEKVFYTRTAAAAMAEFALQGRVHEGLVQSPYEKDSRLTGQSQGIAGYPGLKNDPNAIDKAYNKQYENMMAAMGVALAPIKLDVVKGLTDMFTAIAQFASGNPGMMKAIGIGLGALGLALIGAGAVAIIAAIGTGGWLVAGVIALGAAVAGAAANKDAFMKWREANAADFQKRLDAIWKSIKSSFNSFVSWLAGIPARIMAALSSLHLPSFLGGGPSAPGGAPIGNPAGEAMPGKQGWNVIRPSHAGHEQKLAAVYLDGTKVGDAVINHITKRASLPVEGSPYHDATWQASPLDTALG
jgi:hypothetical protein